MALALAVAWAAEGPGLTGVHGIPFGGTCPKFEFPDSNLVSFVDPKKDERVLCTADPKLEVYNCPSVDPPIPFPRVGDLSWFWHDQFGITFRCSEGKLWLWETGIQYPLSIGMLTADAVYSELAKRWGEKPENNAVTAVWRWDRTKIPPGSPDLAVWYWNGKNAVLMLIRTDKMPKVVDKRIQEIFLVVGL